MKESIKSNALRIKKATRMNSVRKLIALVAVALCAALVVPVLPVWNTVTVYADSSFDATKNSAITSLRNLYNKYNKKYYTEQEYKELTDLYNKAIKKISSMKYSESDTNVQYWKYEEKMKKIQPSILIKYQDKVVKSLEKAYKKLLKQNGYSAFAEQQLSLCKDIIRAAKNKTNVKKAKKTALQNLMNVITLPDETRSDIISYISDNKDISKKKKAELIEKLEGMTDVEDMLSLGALIDYEIPEIVTIDQINNRIKLLCKKYPKYSEDEIRCLVATANLDYIDDSEIYKAFNVKNENELKSKADLFDSLMEDEYYTMSREWGYLYDHSSYSESVEKYMKKSIKYDDMVKFNELFINKKIREYADQLFNITDLMVKKNDTKLTGETITEGVHAGCELAYYIFRTDEYKKYSEPLLYDFGDTRLKGTSAEYAINKYICMASYHLSTTHRVEVCLPEDYMYQLSNYIDTLENPILLFVNPKE